MDELIQSLAKDRYNGIPTNQLLYLLFDWIQEYKENKTQFAQYTIQNIVSELKNRKRYTASNKNSKSYIKLIKDTMNTHMIADFIQRYTEVFLHRGIYTFRCTIHGKDVHPSGRLYDDGSWYCFGCCTGGDVINLVSHLSRCTNKDAINILVSYLGINNTIIDNLNIYTNNNNINDLY